MLGRSADGNLALFVNDGTVSMAADAQFGWGAAYLPTPLTERERVPETEYILEVHRLARAMEPRARALASHFDRPGTEVLGEEIAQGARAWFGHVKEHLPGIGIDLGYPIELMLATRRMGAFAIQRIGRDP
jgi:hypothetical protein